MAKKTPSLIDLIFGTGGHSKGGSSSTWDKHSGGHSSRRKNDSPRPGSKADVKQRHNRNK